MIIYEKSQIAKSLLIVVLSIEVIVICLMFKKRDFGNMVWAVPILLYTFFIIIAVLQEKVIIDNAKIKLSFGIHPYKSKSMNWEDVDCVVKDGLDDLPICRLVSKNQIKTKVINLSGIKDMDLLIIEIVKRAKNAEIAPAFRELAERESKSGLKK